MGMHYLTTRQATRVGRAVDDVERDFGSARDRIDVLENYMIMVRATEQIKANETGTCAILQGKFGAFNAERLADNSLVTVDCYNFGKETIEDGDEVVANWMLSFGSEGGWVIQQKVEDTQANELQKATVGAAAIADGETGDIVIGGVTKSGEWEHATAGKTIQAGTDVWVQGPRSDGVYDIVGADCDGLVDP